MAFPTTIDNPTNNVQPTDTVEDFDHAGQHNLVAKGLVALEQKVGVDGSAVTTSHDYKLSSVTGSMKAVAKAAAAFTGGKILKSTAPNQIEETALVLNADNVLDINSGGTGRSLADPASNRLFGWDNVAHRFDFIVVGSGLTLTGNILTADGSALAVSQNANEDLTTGQTVGVAAFGGGVARSTRRTTTITLPDTADVNVPTRQVGIGGDKIFVIYKVSGASTLKGVVGTIDRATNTISFGTAVTYTTSLNASNDFAICKLDTNKVGVLFAESGAPKQIIICVGTVSGTTITAGSNQNFGSALTNNLADIFAEQLSTDKAVVYTVEASSPNYSVRAFTVSGTTLGTVGSPVSTTDNYYYLVNIGTDKFAMNREDKVRVGTVSGTTITLGTAATLPSGAGSGSAYEYDICSLGTDAFAVTSHQGSTASYAYACSVSGTTITVSSAFDLGVTQNVAGILKIDATHALVNGGFASGKAYKVLVISGASVTDSYDIDDSSSVASILAHNAVQLDGYFCIFDKTDYVNTANDNKLFIQGMALGKMPGIVTAGVARGNPVNIFVKGRNTSQSGLVAGQRYTSSGGGLAMSSSGEFVADSETSVIL